MSELIRSIWPILLALGAGACLVVQAAVSSSLRAALGSWAWPGLVSYVGGTLTMLLVLALRQEPWPSARNAGLHPALWTGGLFGAIYLVLAILLLPRLGAAALIACVVAGQMLFALAIDQFGWLGVPQHSASVPRVIGAALLLVGVALIRR
ncbi:MAG TPA: DMT family transporter [Polyangiaceae bacterium]|jgi:transporter family-2 protein|nr:DMT family transporter [Polyangiaceae bacterium]